MWNSARWRQTGLALAGLLMSCSIWAVEVTPSSLTLEVKGTQTVTVSRISGALKVSNTNGKAIGVKRLRAGLYKITGLRNGAGQIRFKDKKGWAVVSVTVTANGLASSSGSLNGRLLASNCFQCHGTNGTGGFDRLAGKSASEIYGELREFASGQEDSNGIMAAHAMGFTDAQLQAIANYFASVR